MIVASTAVRLFHAAAITICPIILIDPDLEGTARARVLTHEWVHNRQQYWFGMVGALAGALVWAFLSWPMAPSSAATMVLGLLEGWVAGQLLWRFLYLCCLPVKWNALRRRWETQAFLAQGIPLEQIKKILQKPPYYLSE